jgi:hypothetical protein
MSLHKPPIRKVICDHYPHPHPHPHTLTLTITITITLTITITPHTQMETKGNEKNVWDEMKGDEVTLGQNDRVRNERDKMSVGRNEWDEM